MKPSESLFLQTYQELNNSDTDLEIREIAKNHLLDLSPPAGLYFSVETQDLITKEAAQRLAQAIPQTIAQPELSKATLWLQIVTDFHRGKNWGHQANLKAKPTGPLTQEQKVRRELFPYVWALVQAVVIMKAAVYYFGMQSSNEPSLQNDVLFAIALTISFGSLFVFAWRKSHHEDKPK